jgi:hypothetical protein
MGDTSDTSESFDTIVVHLNAPSGEAHFCNMKLFFMITSYYYFFLTINKRFYY